MFKLLISKVKEKILKVIRENREYIKRKKIVNMFLYCQNLCKWVDYRAL